MTTEEEAGLEPVTQSGLDAALVQWQTKLNWRLVCVAVVVEAAIKLTPSLH